MNTQELFAEFAGRIPETAKALPELTTDELNNRVAGHPNSVAWLLWHTGREIDVQLAVLTGEEQVYSALGHRDRLGLGVIGDDIGYGHTSEQAAQIRVDEIAPLVDYIEDCVTALIAYSATLSESELDDVVDWTPPVTRGVRLVSLVDDAVQHLGQAAYAAGALRS